MKLLISVLVYARYTRLDLIHSGITQIGLTLSCLREVRVMVSIKRKIKKRQLVV